MARIKKSYYLPWVLLLACAVFFVYQNGASWEAVLKFKAYIITYLIIIVALFFVLRKKEQSTKNCSSSEVKFRRNPLMGVFSHDRC